MLENAPVFNEPDWLESLQEVDYLMLLDRFWTRIGKTPEVQSILDAVRLPKSHLRPRIKAVLFNFIQKVQSELQIKFAKLVSGLFYLTRVIT